MTAEQAMEFDLAQASQQHDHANESASTEDAHYDAAYGFYLDHGFWPGGASDGDLAGY